MAGNPLVDQGSLNRLLSTVAFDDFPELNVTPSNLAKEGVSLALEGDVTTYLPTMTGAVTSPEPYQLTTCTMHLLKSQPLVAAFQAKIRISTLLGFCEVYPDAITLLPYELRNCAIFSVRELNFSGVDVSWVVTVRGFYLINNSLWNGS